MKRAHYEIQDIQPVFFYVTLNLHKTETSLRQTVGASPEGVCLIELVDCTESGKVFFSYYNVFCMNKMCVTALNVSCFQMLVLATFFPTSDVSPGYMDFMGVCCFPFGWMWSFNKLKPLHTIWFYLIKPWHYDYSLTQLWGHQLNMGMSYLRTVYFVPREIMPLHFLYIQGISRLLPFIN